MNIDRGTCWYNPMCHEEMIRGANGELWPVLEKSLHWPVLKELLDIIPKMGGKKQLLDVGCGAGCLGGLVNKKFLYSGVDLPEVIENVAEKVNPSQRYIKFDVTSGEDMSFMYHYDVIAMNAFIDIMQDPMNILCDILDQCSDYVIIHRQFIIGSPTKVKKADSYGGTTFISYINELDFNVAKKHFHVVKKLSTGLGADNYSFLLQRFKK